MSRDVEREWRERRERIATAVLAGLHSNPTVANIEAHVLAGWAVEAADALMAHLTAADSRDALRAIELKRKTKDEVTA